MSPRHLIERRALYAAIARAGDLHLRPRVVDPRLHHSARSTLGACDACMWIREHTRQTWRIEPLYSHDPACAGRDAVVDDYGDLVEVRP